MYEKVYGKGSRPYFADADLSDVQVGDTIKLLNPTNPRWEDHREHRVQVISEEGIQHDGAWYLISDGWAIQREITPKTVEVIEPFENNWLEYHYSPTRRLRVIRTVEEAAQMIHCEDIRVASYNNIDTAKLHAFEKHLNWTSFATIAKKLGIGLMLRLAEPFYQAALAMVEGKNYYNQTDKNDDVQNNLVLPYPFHFQSLGYGDELNMTYWVLSLAIEEAGFEARDIVKIIETLGIDNYLYYVEQKRTVVELLRLAAEIDNNDIDLALFSHLT